MGLQARFQAGVDADSFHINQAGGTTRSHANEVTPSTALRLRMPLSKSTATGATHVLEPMLQIAWTVKLLVLLPSYSPKYTIQNIFGLCKIPKIQKKLSALLTINHVQGSLVVHQEEKLSSTYFCVRLTDIS